MSHKTTVGIRGTEKVDALTTGWRPLELGQAWAPGDKFPLKFYCAGSVRAILIAIVTSLARFTGSYTEDEPEVSSLVVLYSRVRRGGEKGGRGGEDCQIWRNEQRSLVRQEITQS